MPHYTVENTVHVGLRATVFLNGERVKHVMEAHTDEGWVIRCQTKKDGSFVLTPDQNAIAMERLEGNVTVMTETWDDYEKRRRAENASGA
jgi:hypothetical protein